VPYSLIAFRILTHPLDELGQVLTPENFNAGLASTRPGSGR